MSGLKKVKILIIDDNIDNLNLLSNILLSSQYTVRRAINGALALKSIASSPPNLILLDINLPDMTGFDICTELKKKSNTIDIPVIFISALSEIADKTKAFSLGGVDYICKPFDVAEVLLRVENQLALQSAKAELCILNEALEQRVTERTFQLEQINAQLMRSNQSLQQEIADRKLVQEKLRLFDAIVIESNDAIAITKVESQEDNHNDLEIIYVNNAFIQKTGYSLEEIVGKTPRILQGPNTDISTKAKVRKALDLLQPIQVEILNYKKDGTEFWSDLNIFPVANELGSYTHWISIQRDITTRKKEQQEILQALQREKELNEVRARFVSTTSHEFRTPLATILSSVELLEHYGQLSTDNEIKNYYQQIRTAIARMTTLMDDVLVLDKSGTGKVEIKLAPIDLKEFFKQLISEFTLNDNHDHRILLNFNKFCPEIAGDEKILRQIFSNLLSNSVKYSSQGKEIKIEVNNIKERVFVKIIDQGVGIPLEEQKGLFEPFFRASNVNNFAGTGLGLSIVKNLIGLYGGEIEVESQLNQGTTFTVTFSVPELPASFEHKFAEKIVCQSS